MLDIAWLVFLSVFAVGSLATAMAISGRYEAVVFAITAGFFFTFLSLVIMVNVEWGVNQDIEHSYFYTPGLVAPVTVAEDFSNKSVGDGWQVEQAHTSDTGGITMNVQYNKNRLEFWQTTQTGWQQERAFKVFEADGAIKQIVIHGRAWAIGHNPIMFIKAQNGEGGGLAYSVVPEGLDPSRPLTNDLRTWTILIGDSVTKSVRVNLNYQYGVSSGGEVGAAKLFQITGIELTAYPAPTAKIESITESHGTVWLSPHPQIQMFLATFLGLIGLWAFFYSITCMFQFGPGRAKK